MSIPANFDLEAFQADVLKEVAMLQEFGVPSAEPWQKGLESMPDEEEEVILAQEAQRCLELETVRQVLCAALKSGSDDAGEIAKTVTTVLVTATFAGAVTLPLTPYFVALICIFAARMGTAALCVELTDK